MNILRKSILGLVSNVINESSVPVYCPSVDMPSTLWSFLRMTSSVDLRQSATRATEVDSL